MQGPGRMGAQTAAADRRRERGRPAAGFLLGLAAAAVLGCAPGVGGTTAIARTGETAAPAEHVPFPPPALVSLDNPQSAAVIRHEVEARLDPLTHGLLVTDRMTIVHAPRVETSRPVSFLLWKDLEVSSVAPDPGGPGGPPQARGPKASIMKRFEFSVRDRMKPRDFWAKPPYDELDAYEAARQFEFRPEPAIGVWPETLHVVVTYQGTLMDSLRPPKAAYQRSFEETAGLIEERGAYLCGSSFWIPSRPGEVFTYRLNASVPAEWRAVSQGSWLGRDKTLASREEKRNPARRPLEGPFGGDIWDCPQPMEEIYLVAGPWEVHEADHRGTRVMTYTYADTDSSIYNRYIRGTGRYLDLYTSLFGPYPFSKFALVENFWQTGFGMPSFTLLGDKVIRLPFILDTSYGHEILHNWWGNGVFVDYEQGNWCEGLTTYGADYLYKERESASAARDYRRGALVGYADYVSGGEELPLARFRGRHDAATQAIGYGKSMMVIHQLRRAAGDTKFYEALRDFYRRNLWRRATWDDLLGSFHQTIGLDAAAFRRQWIERAGAPQLSVNDVKVTPFGRSWRLDANLAQTLPDGSTRGEPFTLDVPVRLQWADHDSTFLVTLRSWNTAIAATVRERPQRLLIDPDFEVMRRVQRSEIPPALSQTLGADTVTVVLATGLRPEIERACRELAKSWSTGQTLQLIEEWKQSKGWQAPGSAWYLGLGPAATALLSELPEVRPPHGPRASTDVSMGAAGHQPEPGAAGVAGPNPWRIAGEEHPGARSFVLAGARRDAPGVSWVVVVPADAKAVETIGEKVPHYGKYSYLVFDGPKVVAKGGWSETNSPLVVELAPAEGKAVPGRGKPSPGAGPHTLDRGGKR